MIQSGLLAGAISDSSVPASRRFTWLDRSKGIGIILVVIGHALGGLIDSDLAGVAGIMLRRLFLVIYLFHMPLFFFLAGLTVRARLTKDRGRFVRSQVPALVYPYLLWSIVQFSVIFLLGSIVNRPVDSYWSNIVTLPVRPMSQFWFLYVLFVLHLGAAALVRPRMTPVFIAIAIGARLLYGHFVLPDVVAQLCVFSIFYAAGLLIRADRLDKAGLRWSRALPGIAALCLVGFALVVLLQWRTLTSHEFVSASASALAHRTYEMTALPAAVLGIGAVLTCAFALPNREHEPLAFLGRLSMPIYLLHILFIAGGRIVLSKGLHVTAIGLVLPSIVLAGLLGPSIFALLTARVGITAALGFGTQSSRSSARSAKG